jgi:hypothetical protein
MADDPNTALGAIEHLKMPIGRVTASRRTQIFS